MNITEAGRALRSRKISCVELTARCLDQIDKLNPRLNAFITVTADSARARAAQLDQELASGMDRGPFHGIPIAHKDLIWTKGIRTTSGSKIFADFIPDQDAPVVEWLDQAGAVMLGKTGLHELAFGVTSNNPHFGAVRNPRNMDRIPGGSSGGAGAAVATGMALMATGTDTGGSIRVPAAFCGVAGIKPTYGLVNRSNIQPLGLSLDHIGPLAGNVADCRISLDIMSNGAKRKPAPSTVPEIRVGIPRNFYFTQVTPEVRDAVHKALRKAESLGARMIEVEVPDIQALNTAGLVILLSEAAALHQAHMAKRENFGTDVMALLDQGSLIPAADYINAQRFRKQLVADFRRLFETIDCLFTPTVPFTAPRIGQTEVEIEGETINTRIATTRFVRGINVLGFPALSMPCGDSSDGMPIGLQIIGRPLEENLLFALGEALEQQ